MARNINEDASAEDLDRAFQLALTDALRQEKPAAAVLEVARKTLEDRRAQKRWEQEQDALATGAAASTAEATGRATPSAASLLPPGIKLPFTAKSRGVEAPPAKPASETEANDDKPTTTWEGLNQIPFLTPTTDRPLVCDTYLRVRGFGSADD